MLNRPPYPEWGMLLQTLTDKGEALTCAHRTKKCIVIKAKDLTRGHHTLCYCWRVIGGKHLKEAISQVFNRGGSIPQL